MLPLVKELKINYKVLIINHLKLIHYNSKINPIKFIVKVHMQLSMEINLIISIPLPKSLFNKKELNLLN
jgi:hypothetical protein